MNVGIFVLVDQFYPWEAMPQNVIQPFSQKKFQPIPTIHDVHDQLLQCELCFLGKLRSFSLIYCTKMFGDLAEVVQTNRGAQVFKTNRNKNLRFPYDDFKINLLPCVFGGRCHTGLVGDSAAAQCIQFATPNGDNDTGRLQPRLIPPKAGSQGLRTVSNSSSMSSHYHPPKVILRP